MAQQSKGHGRAAYSCPGAPGFPVLAPRQRGSLECQDSEGGGWQLDSDLAACDGQVAGYLAECWVGV